MTRHALVTGATGFLGHHLALTLVADGWQVSALQRPTSARSAMGERLRSAGVESVVFTSGEDVQRLVSRASPEVVFHLATHYVKEHTPADVPLLIEANVTFGTHLLDGLRGTDAVVVGAMSYFQFREGVPAPISLYSATKQAFLDISDYYRVVSGLDIRQVILYDTFGPEDVRDKLVPRLLAALMEGHPVGLGSAEQPINLLYVDDVVSGFIAAAGQQESSLLCLRSPDDVTVGEVVRTLGDVAGRPVSCSFDNTGRVDETVLHAGTWPLPDGWAAPRTLAEGLERTWRSAAGT